jgi:hypothetical protein
LSKKKKKKKKKMSAVTGKGIGRVALLVERTASVSLSISSGEARAFLARVTTVLDAIAGQRVSGATEVRVIAYATNDPSDLLSLFPTRDLPFAKTDAIDALRNGTGGEAGGSGVTAALCAAIEALAPFAAAGEECHIVIAGMTGPAHTPCDAPCAPHCDGASATFADLVAWCSSGAAGSTDGGARIAVSLVSPSRPDATLIGPVLDAGGVPPPPDAASSAAGLSSTCSSWVAKFANAPNTTRPEFALAAGLAGLRSRLVSIAQPTQQQQPSQSSSTTAQTEKERQLSLQQLQHHQQRLQQQTQIEQQRRQQLQNLQQQQQQQQQQLKQQQLKQQQLKQQQQQEQHPGLAVNPFGAANRNAPTFNPNTNNTNNNNNTNNTDNNHANPMGAATSTTTLTARPIWRGKFQVEARGINVPMEISINPDSKAELRILDLEIVPKYLINLKVLGDARQKMCRTNHPQNDSMFNSVPLLATFTSEDVASEKLRGLYAEMRDTKSVAVAIVQWTLSPDPKTHKTPLFISASSDPKTTTLLGRLYRTYEVSLLVREVLNSTAPGAFVPLRLAVDPHLQQQAQQGQQGQQGPGLQWQSSGQQK